MLSTEWEVVLFKFQYSLNFKHKIKYAVHVMLDGFPQINLHNFIKKWTLEIILETYNSIMRNKKF